MKACFSPYGAIESIRWRSIAFDAKLPRRVAFAKKLFHTERDTLTMYLVFEEKQDITSPDGIKITSGQEAAKKALDLNGIRFLDHVIQVDIAEKTSTKNNSSLSVFVGNLPFNASIQQLHSFFSRCGEIDHTRVVRDKKTNVGKGFGYVQFKTSVAVELAVKMNGAEFMDRKIRVQRSVEKLANKSTAKIVEGARSIKKVSTADHSGDNLKKVFLISNV